MSPFNSADTASSSSEDDSAGFANKSPKTIPSENKFFECNLDNFPKTEVNRPLIAPVTTLSMSQHKMSPIVA